MMNADGSGQREMSTGLELNASPALSPDGSQIAFAGSAQGNADIYVAGTSGRGLRRLTMTHALEASPGLVPHRAADPLHVRPDRHAADLGHGRGGHETRAA